MILSNLPSFLDQAHSAKAHSDNFIVCALHHSLNGEVSRANDQNIFNGGCHLSSFL
jgi:hypothetical protein